MTKTKTTKKPKARNVTYKDWITPEGLILLEGWARDGYTNEEIAKSMGIAQSTLYNWKNQHMEIVEALKKGYEVSNYIVEQSFYKKAIGFKETEKTTEYNIIDGEIDESTIRVTEREKYFPPDTAAGIFLMTNRMPEKWVNKKYVDQKVESTQEVTVKQDNKLEEIIEQDNQKSNEIYKTLFEEYNKSNDEKNKE